MNHEERLFAAMNNETPDRVPTFSLLSDPNVINEALGARPLPILDFLRSERGAAIVDRVAPSLDRFFPLAMFLFGLQSMRASRELGFDGLWMGYWHLRVRNHRELDDVFGRLFDIVDDGHGNPYMMYRDGLIDSPEAWRSWPRPSIASYATWSLRLVRAWRALSRGKIAVVPFIGPGLWENSWQPMGFARFVALMRTDPDFVREVVGYFTALSVAIVDAYARAGIRVMGFGEDLAYKAGPMVSPKQLEEFYGEGYRQITAAAHRRGAKIFIHCCGNTEDLVEKFVEWGFDGAHAFEPTAGNDLAEARAKVGDRLCFIGNIDVTRILVDAPKEEVEDAVRRAAEGARGGGFVLAPTHTHGNMNVRNVRWMIEAAERLVP